MSPNLHEDASRVRDESKVDYLELWPPLIRAMIPVATTGVLVHKGLSLLQGVRVISADLHGANEVYGLPQGLDQCDAFYSARENLKHLLFQPFRKEVYATPSSKSRIRTASW